MRTTATITPQVEQAILLLRGQRVLLDTDLAALYGVPVSTLNQAVKRNITRFPADFLFQLTNAEAAISRSRPVTLNARPAPRSPHSLRSQSVISNERGGRRYLPYAFTEQGVAMLSSVLRSPRAIQVNIEIMRTFVRLRQMLQSNAELARKLDTLEKKKYDGQFRVVFDAIRQLMTPPAAPRKRIGFTAK